MKCEDVRKILVRMQDEAEKPEPGCMEHISQCPRCRAFYQALLMARGEEHLSAVSPPGLEDRVMDRIGAAPEQEKSKVPRGLPVFRALPFLRPLPLSRQLSLPRPLQLAAAAVLLVVLSVTLTLAVTSHSRNEVLIVHLYLSAPDAQRVAVVGDWNSWDTESDLLHDRDGDGLWETRIEVSRGQEYQYQFLIDGDTWIADPNAPIKVDDGFGGTNSVLDI